MVQPAPSPVLPVFHVDGRAEVDGHGSTWWDEYGVARTAENAANLDKHDPDQGLWRIPTDRGKYLGPDDLYWRDTAEAAQNQYGDTGIHYGETGLNGAKRRFLAFGNGQALPGDGRIVYRLGEEYYQLNSDETVSRWIPKARDSGEGHLDGEPIHTQARQLPVGTWALFDPKTNKQVSASSATRPPDSPPPVVAPAAVPAGMHTLHYPGWAASDNPAVATQLTAALARLYTMFGQGAPATASTPAFPFNTDTGQDSGIDCYNDLRRYFQKLEREFNSAATGFRDAVKASKFDVDSGRRAINDAIEEFNRTAAALPVDAGPALIEAESNALATARGAVARAAAASPHPLPQAPDPTRPLSSGPGPQAASAAPGAPASPVAPLLPSGPLAPLPAVPGSSSSGMGGPLSRRMGLAGGGLPAGAMGNPLGSRGGLGGLNPLGAGSALSPLAALASPARPAAAKMTGPPPAAAPPAPAVPDGQGGPARQPAVVPIANTGGPSTVLLPDGKTVDAPNPQAAAAAQNALDKASPGGDAAYKAYSGVMDLPGEGKPLGDKINPADMQAGDVLKWADKTMVAVGPGLVADPTHPGVVHQLGDILHNSTGFEGIFRPPTHAPHSISPPVLNVTGQHAAPATPSTIAATPPPAQPAPPSPFEPASADHPGP